MRLLNFLKSILRALTELFLGTPRSDTGNHLRDFLIDLSNDEKLQDKFAKEPKKLMDKYELTAEQQGWVLKGDTESINKSIGESYSSNTWVHVSKK